MNTKKISTQIVFTLFTALIGTKLGEAWRLAEGTDAPHKLLSFTQGLSSAFQSPFPSFVPFDLLIGLTLAALIRLYIYAKSKDAKKYRKGMEYGSARWGTAKDIKPFMDPKFENNIILTKTERLTMASRVPNPAYARNKDNFFIL
ncbi:MAG: hypothetical protein IKP72_14560 [Clostridia bacterium]|nr:hypothetical protein [Clostridia bacterium]